MLLELNWLDWILCGCVCVATDMYPAHLPHLEILQGESTGKYVRGKFQLSRDNRQEANVYVHGSDESVIPLRLIAGSNNNFRDAGSGRITTVRRLLVEPQNPNANSCCPIVTHKKLELIAPVFLSYCVNSKVFTYVHAHWRMELLDNILAYWQRGIIIIGTKAMYYEVVRYLGQ